MWEGGEMLKKFRRVATPKRIVGLTIVILVLVFGFQNRNSIELSVIFFSIKLPLIVLIVALYVLGVISGWMFKRNDVKKIVSDVQKETKEELAELKNQLSTD